MRHLFLPGVDLGLSQVPVAGPDFHHLVHVLRIRAGEPLLVLDDRGGAAAAEVAEIGKRELLLRILSPAPAPAEPRVRVTVAQAPGKGDRFEQVLQHATEVGAAGFLPLLTERTVVRFEPRDLPSKLERWRQVLKGAAEQSGRGRIPTVEAPVTLAELAEGFHDWPAVLLLDREGRRLSQALRACTPAPERLLVLVGPEGGFTPEEIRHAQDRGALPTCVSPFTLRTETAPLAAVAQILFALGEEGRGAHSASANP